jgi:large subunit ribosomal protein L18
MKAKTHSDNKRKWLARRKRTRSAIGRTDRVLLSVYRSSKHIYAQLIDPLSGDTIGTVSSRNKAVVPDGQGGNIEAAKQVGAAIAEFAKSKNVEQVVFNRNGFLYHGRVKALADAAREAGLQF